MLPILKAWVHYSPHFGLGTNPPSPAKTFQHEGLENILAAIDLPLSDLDKFRQRAGAEILVGVLRGSYTLLAALWQRDSQYKY